MRKPVSAGLLLIFLLLAGCGSATDGVLEAVEAKNPNVVGFRNVTTDDVGDVCGLAIEHSGRIDRFHGHSTWSETVVNLESEMDQAILRSPGLGTGFEDVGVRLKAGFLQAFEECMASGA